MRHPSIRCSVSTVAVNEAVLAVDDDNGRFPFMIDVYGYVGDGALLLLEIP